MADSFITSPRFPVNVSFPLPLFRLASIYNMSPPTRVHAKPIATPESLAFAYFSLEYLVGPRIFSRSSTLIVTLDSSSIATRLATCRITPAI